MDKKRCNNFSKDEIQILIDLVELHKEIIECKKTDTLTSGMKDVCWQKIEQKFNAFCGTGRTGKMLRSKWDSLKKTTRKEYAEYKQSLYQTGGGPAVDIKLPSFFDKILAIIGVGATGTVSNYDSDFVEDRLNTDPGSPIIVEERPRTEVIADVPITEIPTSSWESWNPQLLRQPVSKALQIFVNDSSVIDTQTAAEIIENPSNLEIPKNSTKRKREVDSTAAKLQKQRSVTTYEDLARKKIEFIDFQMELLRDEARKKEQRSAEKHELEMEILRAELEQRKFVNKK